MGTLYTEIYELFLDIVAEDVEFFEYRGATVSDSQSLILKRCKKYLKESCIRISERLVEYERDFLSRNDSTEVFDLVLTDMEMSIIASVMFEKHKEKGLAEFKAMSVFLHDANITAINPTTERTKYREFVDKLVYDNDCKIDSLLAKNGNKLKLPTYSDLE